MKTLSSNASIYSHVSDIQSVLGSKSLRPNFSLLHGDILEFEEDTPVAIERTNHPNGKPFEVIMIRATLNGRQGWFPMSAILGLGALKHEESKREYAKASHVNSRLASCFDLHDVYNFIVGKTFECVAKGEYLSKVPGSDERCHRTYPIFNFVETI